MTGRFSLHASGAGIPSTMNCYAVAEDLQGRIWVGTDNQGVVVWNGETWKAYDQLSGLLGERVFAIRVSPVTGFRRSVPVRSCRKNVERHHPGGRIAGGPD